MGKRLTTWLLRQSLWLAGIGLMLASSGIDGAYLVRIMPADLGWLGYVLNTTSDVVSQIIMYWFGRLQQDRSTKKQKLSTWLLIAEAVLVGYAWFFGWRQLRLVLPAIEGAENTRWVAPVAAAFTPVGIAAVGYAQSLLAGRIEAERDTRPAQAAAQGAEQFSGNGKGELYKYCSLCKFPAYSPQSWAGHCKGAEHQRRAAEAAAQEEAS